MKIVIKKRNDGKTDSAVEWLKEKPYSRIIVVISESEKRRVMKKYDLTYQQVETANTVLHHYHMPNIRGEFPYPKEGKEFFIDNVDMVLGQLFHGRVGGFSAIKEQS